MRQRCYVVIKVTVYQEDKTITNFNHQIRTTGCIKQKFLKIQRNKNKNKMIPLNNVSQNLMNQGGRRFKMIQPT